MTTESMTLEEIKVRIDKLKATGIEVGDANIIFESWELNGHYEEAKKYFQDLFSVDKQFLPSINISNRPNRDITSQMLEVIETSNKPEYLFVRGGVINRLDFDKKDKHPFIAPITESGLRGIADRTANFTKTVKTKDGFVQVPAAPPLEIIRDAISLPLKEVKGEMRLIR